MLQLKVIPVKDKLHLVPVQDFNKIPADLKCYLAQKLVIFKISSSRTIYIMLLLPPPHPV